MPDQLESESRGLSRQPWGRSVSGKFLQTVRQPPQGSVVMPNQIKSNPMPIGWMALGRDVFRKKAGFTRLIVAFAKIPDHYALAQGCEPPGRTADSGQAHFFAWPRRHDRLHLST